MSNFQEMQTEIPSIQGINFRTMESQKEYFDTYNTSLQLIHIPFTERYVHTSYGESHVLCCGAKEKPPLVLLHAASCGSTIWYKNIEALSCQYSIYAIDLLGETSKSLMTKRMAKPIDNAKWLNETLDGLKLEKVNLCGLSIGGWNSANYASIYPERVNKLVLLSPVQTFAKMYGTFFFKIMKMGFHPTRENIEAYIGWGNEKEEERLPDSIIKLFTISVMNMSGNASFPVWLKANRLRELNMPVLVMMGENEFAFSPEKAVKRIEKYLTNAEVEVIEGASHLVPVSNPEVTNAKVLQFLCNQ